MLQCCNVAMLQSCKVAKLQSFKVIENTSWVRTNGRTNEGTGELLELLSQLKKGNGFSNNKGVGISVPRCAKEAILNRVKGRPSSQGSG